LNRLKQPALEVKGRLTLPSWVEERRAPGEGGIGGILSGLLGLFGLSGEEGNIGELIGQIPGLGELLQGIPGIGGIFGGGADPSGAGVGEFVDPFGVGTGLESGVTGPGAVPTVPDATGTGEFVDPFGVGTGFEGGFNPSTAFGPGTGIGTGEFVDPFGVGTELETQLATVAGGTEEGGVLKELFDGSLGGVGSLLSLLQAGAGFIPGTAGEGVSAALAGLVPIAQSALGFAVSPLSAAVAPIFMALPGIMAVFADHRINEGKIERKALGARFNTAFEAVGLSQDVDFKQWQNIIGGQEGLDASGLEPLLGAVTAATLSIGLAGGGGAGGGPMIINGLIKSGASPQQAAGVVASLLGPNWPTAIETIAKNNLDHQAFRNLVNNSRQTMVLEPGLSRKEISAITEDKFSEAGAGRQAILDANSEFFDDMLGSLQLVYGVSDEEVSFAKEKLMLAREAMVDDNGPHNIASFTDIERNQLELDNLTFNIDSGNQPTESGLVRLDVTEKMLDILQREHEAGQATQASAEPEPAPLTGGAGIAPPSGGGQQPPPGLGNFAGPNIETPGELGIGGGPDGIVSQHTPLTPEEQTSITAESERKRVLIQQAIQDGLILPSGQLAPGVTFEDIGLGATTGGGGLQPPGQIGIQSPGLQPETGSGTGLLRSLVPRGADLPDFNETGARFSQPFGGIPTPGGGQGGQISPELLQQAIPIIIALISQLSGQQGGGLLNSAQGQV